MPKLTARSVAALNTPGRYGDGGGLWLQVSSSGTKAWLLRYMRNGQARHMGLGPITLVTLAAAREKAREARRLLLDGVDPLEHRRAKLAQAGIATAQAVGFKEAADRYIAAHEVAWKHPVHRRQWPSSLAMYAYPVLGALPVAAIDTGLIVKVLEPIWTAKPETAGRVRARIENVLDWAKARGYRDGENPARWRGHLDHLLPDPGKVRRTEHFPALAYTDIPQFMADLRELQGSGARALEFLVLTAARTTAVIGGTWDEIDLRERIWIVPASRAGTKIGDDKPRRVPLSDRALQILTELRGEDGNPHVFVGGKRGRGLSNMAMAKLLKSMGYPSTTQGKLPTVHGMRSTFKDWASERTNYPGEVSEAALWHVVADKVEAAYRRGDLFEKRRRLMNDWARYCSKRVTDGGSIVSLARSLPTSLRAR